MNCPSDTDCYAVDPWSRSGAGLLETTADGGQTWYQVALANGWQFTSGLACPSAEHCLAAGTEHVPGAGQAAIVLSTSDGGSAWNAADLPPSVTNLSHFTCAPGGECVGAGYGPSPSAGVPPPPLVVTSGQSGAWQVVELGPDFGALTADDLACMSTSNCVLVGAVTDATNPRAVALFSTDGGQSWNEATLPAGLAQVQSLSCPDSEHCLAIANPPEQSGSTSPRASEIIATADGGHSWRLDGSTGAMSLVLTSISCATSSECWASGQSAVTPVGAVVHTTDGGTSWTAVQLPISAVNAAVGSRTTAVQNVSTVSCTAGGVCTALGAQVVPPTAIRQVVLRSD